jgi:hypothetical protein
VTHHISPSSRYHTPRLITITMWFYRCLLIFHPPAFRRDYGEAILQVFRQTCIDAYQIKGMIGVIQLWLPALSDLVGGSLAEYATLLHHIMKGPTSMLQYRRSASMIFAAYIAFVIAGIGFAKMAEDIMKSSLPATYPILAGAYYAVMIGAILSLLAVLAGGIPIALAALRFAFANRRADILARFAVPPIALAVIAGYTGLIMNLNVGGNTAATIHTPQRIVGVGSVVAVFIIGAIASTIAVLDAIKRSEIDERLFRFTVLPEILTVIAMLITMLAHVFWSIGLWQDAPNHFWGNDGFLASSTLLATSIQVLVMAIAMLTAAYAVRQSLNTRRATSSLA